MKHLHLLQFATAMIGIFLFHGVFFYFLERIFPPVDVTSPWTFRKITFKKLFFWVFVIFFYLALGERYLGEAVLRNSNEFLEMIRDLGLFWPTIDISFLPPLLQGILFFTIQDLLFYLSHRFLGHGVLWNIHKIHHADKDLDWMTTVVVHPCEHLIALFTGCLVFTVIPISPLSFVFVSAGKLFFGTLPHSNIRLPFGKYFERVIVTPQAHRLHHRKDLGCQHSNYATAFSFWDFIFKTFRQPESIKVSVANYGINDSNLPKSFFGQIIYPLQIKLKNFKE